MKKAVANQIDRVKVITVMAGATVVTTLIVPLTPGLTTSTRAAQNRRNIPQIYQVIERESINIHDAQSFAYSLRQFIPHHGALLDYLSITPAELKEYREEGFSLADIAMKQQVSVVGVEMLIEAQLLSRWQKRLEAGLISPRQYDVYVAKRKQIIVDFVYKNAHIERIGGVGKMSLMQAIYQGEAEE